MLRLLPATLLIAAIALLAAWHDAGAEIYEWVDSEGRTQFTNDLKQVPTSQRAAAIDRASSRRQLIRESPPEAEAPAKAKSEEMECRPNGLCFSKGANVRFPGDPRKNAEPGNPDEMKVNGQDKTGWKRQAQQFRDRIALLESQIEQMEAAGLDHAPAERHGRMSRRNFEKYLSRNGAYENAKRDLDRERSSYARFLENARRAGVPPGWLR